MVVKKLEINGFRNLNGLAIEPHPGKNLIFGANGSGKTSVIEALYFLGFGKSFLPVCRRDLVRTGAAGFFLQAEVADRLGEQRVSARLETGLSLRLNGERAQLVEVSRHLYPLFFSHFLYSQVIDGVPLFRKLIDRFIFGLSSLYLHDVLRYNTALKQKNCLLRNWGKPVDISELQGWNALLAETGSKLIKKRREFTDQLNEAMAEAFGGSLSLDYHPAAGEAHPEDAAALLQELTRARDSERKARRALVGPQRDRFEMNVSGRRLALFSSGEKKKYLLMLYTAYIGLFRRCRGEHPVLLLDDFDAVMDEDNLEFVLSHFPALQVIATSVAPDRRFERRFELKKE